MSVEPGTFKMGSPLQSAVDPYEWPQHRVTLTRPFEASVTEITWAQYTRLMGDNPSHYYDLCPNCELSHPIESVTWLEAVTFCNALSLDEGLTPAYGIVGEDVTWDQAADGYRLLTEAEWEYTCRAGTQTDLANGSLTYTPSSCDYDELLMLIGWYCNNSGYLPHPVGQLDDNAWGFYDMHGNVWEWVWDWSGPYENVPVTLGDFYFSNGSVERLGSLSVIQFLQAFGDGLMIRFTRVGSNFNISNLDITTSEINFAYADFAGEVNLRVNNDIRHVGVFTDFPTAIAPGVTLSVTAEQFIDAAFGEGVKGEITLTGEITSLGIGGQILLVDDMNILDSGTGQYDLDRLVNFNTMSLGYVYRPAIDSVPIPILMGCSVTDPIGPTAGAIHMMRGGGYGNGARTCRSATRSLPNKGRYTGFRVARYLD
ncbi:formylglycine-generating enzyme family protein [bacterium]|nr:formylglycine-generating enzyme family protein [bacterium]MBU1071726.1 formylglycine-generating enzyme family protein [bacterium]MBU1675050.1 formylglycine-generating enzyme family protein [bacterium]